MAQTIRLRITAPFAIHGKKPGDEWDEPAEDGVPLKREWRKRLDDEATYKTGHVVVTTSAPAKPAAPAAPDTPAPSKKG